MPLGIPRLRAPTATVSHASSSLSQELRTAFNHYESAWRTENTGSNPVGPMGCHGPKMRRSNVFYGVSGTIGGGRRSGEREIRPR